MTRWRAVKDKSINAKLCHLDLGMDKVNYYVLRGPGCKWYGVCERRGSKSNSPWNWQIGKHKLHMLSTHFDLRAAKATVKLLEKTYHAPH
jgi:hypothetical protein